MAKTFKMPENLDIHYKFFGGKFDFKEIGFRLIGLVPALPAGILIFSVTQNIVWALIISGIFFLLGVYIGGKKVFNKQVNIYQAIFWKRELNRKTRFLYNTRTGNNKD